MAKLSTDLLAVKQIERRIGYLKLQQKGKVKTVEQVSEMDKLEQKLKNILLLMKKDS